MRSPLDHIGRRPKRSPFGTDLHIYKPPRPARSLRAKFLLVAFMCVATLATGLFIHVRLSQKPSLVAAVEPTEAAVPDGVAVATAQPVSPVKPKMVQTVSIPAALDTDQAGIDADALGHNNPRWARANLEAATAKSKGARTLVSAPEKPAADVAAEATLAYADDAATTPGSADEETTAAIEPAAAVPLANTDEQPSSADANVSRTVRMAKAVNLRASARSGSRVIKVLPAGATVGLVSCDAWCEVTFQGSRGFIYKSFVQGGGSAKPRASAPRAQNVAQKKASTPFRQVTQR